MGTELATVSGSATSNALTKFDGSGDVVASSLSDNGSIVSLGSESVVLNRTSVLNGTLGTLMVSAGMGGGASASVMVGTDQAVQISLVTVHLRTALRPSCTAGVRILGARPIRYAYHK